MVAGVNSGQIDRRRADIIAGITAVIALVIAGGLLWLSPAPAERRNTVTTTETTATIEGAAGASPGVTRTMETVTERAATDTSVLASVLASPGARVLVTVALVLLAAFLVGAFAQRVLLGAYAVTVGPTQTPAIAEVAASELVAALKEIADTVAPNVRAALYRAPGAVTVSSHAVSRFGSIEDPRLQFLSIRTELEARLRDLAEAAGIDRDIRLSRLLARLRVQAVVDESAESGLQQLLDLGDRVAEGAVVTEKVLDSVRSDVDRLLNALGDMPDLARRQSSHRKPSVVK